MLPFTTEDEVPAARWAMHLAARIYWLEGHLVQDMLWPTCCLAGYSTGAIALFTKGKLYGPQRCAAALHGLIVCSAFSSCSSCVANAGQLTTDYTRHSTARQSRQSYMVTCSSRGHHRFEQLGFKTATAGELMGQHVCHCCRPRRHCCICPRWPRPVAYRLVWPTRFQWWMVHCCQSCRPCHRRGLTSERESDTSCHLFSMFLPPSLILMYVDGSSMFQLYCDVANCSMTVTFPVVSLLPTSDPPLPLHHTFLNPFHLPVMARARVCARLNSLDDHFRFCCFVLGTLADCSEQCQRVGLNACRSLRLRDCAGALRQLDALRIRQKVELASVMSPGCCAQQALLSADVHTGLANTRSGFDKASEVVKALMACELVVALQPSCRREVCCLSCHQLSSESVEFLFSTLHSGTGVMSDSPQAQMLYALYLKDHHPFCPRVDLFLVLLPILDAQHTLHSPICTTEDPIADCVPQLFVLCLLQAFHKKVPLLDVLAAYPAKVDLLDSVLSDFGLTAQERACVESIKAIAVQQQEYAVYGGRLDYKLLFGLKEPVRWNPYQDCATGFNKGTQVCCAVVCCALFDTHVPWLPGNVQLPSIGVLLPPSSFPFFSAAFILCCFSHLSYLALACLTEHTTCASLHGRPPSPIMLLCLLTSLTRCVL